MEISLAIKFQCDTITITGYPCSDLNSTNDLGSTFSWACHGASLPRIYLAYLGMICSDS
jgi:hypothetical protein